MECKVDCAKNQVQTMSKTALPKRFLPPAEPILSSRLKDPDNFCETVNFDQKKSVFDEIFDDRRGRHPNAANARQKEKTRSKKMTCPVLTIFCRGGVRLATGLIFLKVKSLLFLLLSALCAKNGLNPVEIHTTVSFSLSRALPPLTALLRQGQLQLTFSPWRGV